MPSITAIEVTTDQHTEGDLPSEPTSFIQAVRDSCRKYLDAPNSTVSVNETGIEDFLDSLDLAEWDSLAGGSATLGMPLKFSSVEEEANVIALIDLFNFGSGYRIQLKEVGNRGAFQTIQFGIMAMHISGKKLDATYLENLTLSDATQLFDFPISREVPHPQIPIVTIVEPTELKKFAQNLVQVANETGEILRKNGYASLGAFVLESARGSGCSAASLTEKLVRAFPAFRDLCVVNGEPVYIFKKAQLLCADLHRRFNNTAATEALFQFSDMATLPIFADNVLPSMLIHHAILTIPSWLADKITRDEVLTAQEAFALRAAAVVACEEIVRRANEKALADGSASRRMTESQLDYFLWKTAKKGALREEVNRIVFKETVFF